MTASIEWVCSHAGVLRVHPGHGVLGDPYTFCLTVVRDGPQALLKGMVKAPTAEEANAVEDVLRREGFKRRRYWVAGDDSPHDAEL